MTRHSILLLSLLTQLLTVSQSQPAGAACELRSAVLGDEGSGTGGTGLSGDEDHGGTGTGGTGIYAQGGSGAGGTGLAPGDDASSGSGLGGTGIMGIITGFGSVCVNGFEIDYDAETVIERNGEQAKVADLAVGHVVRIQTRRGNPQQAMHLAVESALAGPVERIDTSRGKLWIMGQEVQLRARGLVYDQRSGKTSSLGKIEVGSHVDVSGLRRGDGVVVATRLDQRPASLPSLVTGIANRVSADTVYVGGLRSTLKAKQAGPEPGDSDRVLLRGNWNSNTKTLERAQVDRAPIHRRGVRNLSIQGFLADHQGGDLRIHGTRLDLADVQGVESLRSDSLVRVEGRLDSHGRLRASRLIIEERGRAGMLLSERSEAREGKAGESDRSEREDREGREERSGRSERQDRPERETRPERSER